MNINLGTAKVEAKGRAIKRGGVNLRLAVQVEAQGKKTEGEKK